MSIFQDVLQDVRRCCYRHVFLNNINYACIGHTINLRGANIVPPSHAIFLGKIELNRSRYLARSLWAV